MTDSIREQILTNFGTRLAEITTANQYNSNMGKTVLRSFLPAISGELVPAIGFHLEAEENLELYHREEVKELPIRVQGVENFGSTQPPVAAELLYADMCECVLCDQWSLGFDSGGTDEIAAGDTITGETSTATGLVVSVSIDSGTWAGGDAAGSFTLRRVTGSFQNNEDLAIGAATGQATVDGTATGTSALTLSTGGLAEQITFSTGNVQIDENENSVVGVQIIFRIRYRSIAGNPYSQTI